MTFRVTFAPPEMATAPDLGPLCHGASRARTDDLLHAMQALSQLSYGPTSASSLAAHERYSDRVRRLRRRISRLVRALFGGHGGAAGRDDVDGGVGVREPRRPLAPTLTGAAALDLPGDDADSR